MLLSDIERDVSLTARIENGSQTWNIVLRGKIDYAALVRIKSQLFTLLFEVTEYRDAPESVKHRLLAYASAIYGERGFPVVPVLLIMKDEETIDDVLVLMTRTAIPGLELKKAVTRLVRVLSAGEDVRPANSEICPICDLSLKRLCPYAH